ncbi:hypothetical protein CYMTET_5696 [Cymbomonas tetramitiformis]|uniref:Uncharacterized protein n=1 Tax=Cymbomonas tetramitiformis TaxID=36881 RepID=A0AAE0GZ29_9CHLO|nr:hypothetical protein CYMTET_5696 [Cymbomonas tetramitiformis]
MVSSHELRCQPVDRLGGVHELEREPPAVGAMRTVSASALDQEPLELGRAQEASGHLPATEVPRLPEPQAAPLALVVATPAKLREPPRRFRAGDRVSCPASCFDVPELKTSTTRGHAWRWSHQNFGGNWYREWVQGEVVAHASVAARVVVRCSIDNAMTELAKPSDLRLLRPAPEEGRAGGSAVEASSDPRTLGAQLMARGSLEAQSTPAACGIFVPPSASETLDPGSKPQEPAKPLSEPEAPDSSKEAGSSRSASDTAAGIRTPDTPNKRNAPGRIRAGDRVSCPAYCFDDPEQRKAANAGHSSSRRDHTWRWSYQRFGAHRWWDAQVEWEVLGRCAGNMDLVRVRWEDGDVSLAPHSKLRLLQDREREEGEGSAAGAQELCGSCRRKSGLLKTNAGGKPRIAKNMRPPAAVVAKFRGCLGSASSLCCIWCQKKSFGNTNSLFSHQSRCKLNPRNAGGSRRGIQREVRGGPQGGVRGGVRGDGLKRPKLPQTKNRAPQAKKAKKAKKAEVGSGKLALEPADRILPVDAVPRWQVPNSGLLDGRTEWTDGVDQTFLTF